MSEIKYEALLEGLFEGVYFVDRDRRITYWNKGAERITGYPRAEVVGRPCRDGLLCHVDERGAPLCGDGCPLSATMADRQSREAHVFLRHKDGHRLPVRVAATAVVDGSGQVVGAVESFFEEADWRASEELNAALEQLAYVDGLTGLANRRYLEQRLAAKLDELARYSWPCGVLLIDVDDFKRINDTHGHEAGDAALRTVARTLAAGVRGLDLVGRWGGEEFLVIVGNPASPAALVAVGERLRALVAASDLAGTAPGSVTVSVGAALARAGEAAGDLLRRADAQLYRAKSAGRDRVCGGES